MSFLPPMTNEAETFRRDLYPGTKPAQDTVGSWGLYDSRDLADLQVCTTASDTSEKTEESSLGETSILGKRARRVTLARGAACIKCRDKKL